MRIVEHYMSNPPNSGEKHHIVPKCIGGTDDVTNLVLLPYKAHFICHWILTKIYPNNKKLKHAFAMMCVVTNKQDRIFSAAQYELARKSRSSALKGVPRSEEVKMKLRKPKASTENYKKQKSKQHRSNIGKAHKGRKHHWHNKVVNSEGYKAYHQKRTEKMLELKQFHRDRFISMKISRKEYFTLNPNISPVTLKKYLTGL